MTQLVSPQDDKTKMVQPPNPDKTEMVKEPEKKNEELRWIKALRPIRLPDGTSLREGDVAKVPVPVAKEFCLKKFNGPYAFSGERVSKSADAQPSIIVRAVLVTDADALKLKAMMVTAKSHLDEELPEPEPEVEQPKAL